MRIVAAPTLRGPGPEELRTAAPPAQCGRPPLRVKEEQEPAMAKSYHGEIGDCDGNSESGMGSSVCMQGSVRDQSESLVGWRREWGVERLQELEGLMNVVHLELKGLVIRKAQSLERIEAANSKCK